MTPKNPFADKEYGVAVREWKARNSARRKRQEERKLKREEKLAKGKKVRKKRAKKTQTKRGGKKKWGRAGPKKKSVGKAAKKVKLLLKNDSRLSNHAAGEENKESQVNPAGTPPRPDRVNSVQKNTFLDRRLNTEAFLVSLEENH